MRIGVFDSGIGGINVLSCLIKKYPNNQYIYFGDTKNLPYGSKSKEELLSLASSSIDFLITKKVDLIVIACGTISSNCYNELKKKYQIPLYDIISPTIKYLEKSNYNNIGVIGTEKTIESKVFNIKNKHVLMHKTPSFVPIIENNQCDIKKSEIIKELTRFKNSDILVLGCTHYPVLNGLIEEELKIKTLNMGDCLLHELSLTNNDDFSCELYFSLLSTNLVINVNKILNCNYQIYIK